MASAYPILGTTDVEGEPPASDGRGDTEQRHEGGPARGGDVHGKIRPPPLMLPGGGDQLRGAAGCWFPLLPNVLQ